MRSARLLPALALLAFLPLAGAETPPKEPLTLDAVARFPRGTGALAEVAWRDAGRLTWIEREGGGEHAPASLWEWDLASGSKRKLLDPIPVPLKRAGKENGKRKNGRETEPRTLSLAGATWNAAGTELLLSGEEDLWIWDANTKALTRLTDDEDEEEVPTFSPDGSRVAFVKKNDLWMLDVATHAVRRLTSSGSPVTLNGRLDWVYEEELAGRGKARGYEWFPDGKAIAYLRLDESPVPEYPLVDFRPEGARLEPQRYPRAGEPNPVASFHVVRFDEDGEIHDHGVAFDGDTLIYPDFSFPKDGRSACLLRLDRTQTKLEAFLAPRDGDGAPRPLFSESDPAWVNVTSAPHFLPDGTFLVLTERTGFFHLERHAADGSLMNAVTKGDWMIDRDVQVDDAGGWIYFLATEKDPRERHVYRVRPDGSGFARLTSGRGTHSFHLAPDGKHWLDSWSTIETPARTTIRRADGAEVALVAQAKDRLAGFAAGTVELGSFRGKDGTLFYTSLVRPPGFDPAKRYPVVVDVYGGPHAQTVRDAYGTVGAFDRLLASKGFLVFGMDNRGSWGRGHAFETAILRRTGARELADQLEGVAWLKAQPWVDPERIGIWGWSYGGYMTLYAATHAGGTFRCAAAGAPVTDWRYYDSIYTERYMKLPKENPAGYEASSDVAAAKDLSAKLLVLHGTSDDNVHLENTVAFADAAARAGKEFTFVPLPRQKHGPRDPAMRRYTWQRILSFFEENLGR